MLEDLNATQRQAAMHIKGPELIIAGAGSGKTKTLTYRIAYLLSKGVSPFSIIALTFTNKAAKEMQQRIEALVGVKAKNILMGTFHSIFARILRIEGKKIGYNSNFTIYDTEDCAKIIAQIIKDLNLDSKKYTKQMVASRISKAKNGLFSPQDYSQSGFATEDRKNHCEDIYKIYQLYQKRLYANMAMDFDDILFNMNVLLRDCPEVLEKYSHKFEYILVDEYQDTNYSQYIIIKKLACYWRNICVVGDDAQSIYSFRGAKIENILSFQKNYPNAKVFKLEQNYRSCENILLAANSVISKNKSQIPKKLFTNNEKGDKINYCVLPNDRQEAMWIINNIQQLAKQNTPLCEISILYRNNSQSRVLEDTLRLNNIKYIIYSGLSFYARKEIKDCIAYLRLVVNPEDNESFERIINYPSRGLGQTSIDKVKIYATKHNLSYCKSIESIAKNRDIELEAKKIDKLISFYNMIMSFNCLVKDTDAYSLCSQIIARSGIESDLKLFRSEQDEERLSNVQEFINSIQAFVEDSENSIVDALTGEEIDTKNKTLDIFLQQVSLLSAIDTEDSDNDDYVKLMTIHASKGLEFDTVFLPGLEEGTFPSSLSGLSQENLEEERRLFYVAITRAKKHLFISSTQMRYKYGTLQSCTQSRFVNDIDSKYINQEDHKNKESFSDRFNINSNDTNKPIYNYQSFRQKRENDSCASLNKKKHIGTLKPIKPIEKKPINLNPKDGDNWIELSPQKMEEGMIVKHKIFGIGQIESIYLVDNDLRAKVNFPSQGQTKILVLKFSKLLVKPTN